jgi:A/G-specific adenine glycosylase
MSVSSEAGTRRRRALRRWFKQNQRDFSWRRTRDSWHTLVAETLLRRTRAAQVEHRIAEVLAKYPTPGSLARAPLDQVRIDLRPFGLVWRADNLVAMARVIADDYRGRVPTDIKSLMSLPGVGPYVAAATSAAVVGTAVSLVDTNTVRVATRVRGTYRSGDIRRQSDVVAAIGDLLGGAASVKDWWAVLDLGALVCISREPRCRECPIRADCVTGRHIANTTAAGSCCS